MSTPRVHGDDQTTVNLLWTGGWDSTYRLLQLLLRHRVRVAPYYLEDPTRPSTQIEISTMARIADALHQRFPHTRGLLQPVRRAAVSDIEVDRDIADALRDIRRRMFIGSQYAWLPAFCRRESLDGMELGVHVDDKVQAVLRQCTMEFDHPAGFRSIRVDLARAGAAEQLLFGRFTFPLFQVDKRDIERDALASGWGELMEMTWFCHKPVRGRPCGFCPPCVYTIEEGLARRVPQSRRMLSFFYRSVALPLKTSLRQMRASRQGRRPSPESRARNG